MKETKTMKTPMSSSIKLDKDEKGKSIDSTMYRGMIGFLLYLTTSRPDIIGTCHFLGHSLVSWHSKKQNLVALSTTKAEYIAVGLCCA
ncbi:hypothetical protein AAG906_003315 [Vitis piasezkii]